MVAGKIGSVYHIALPTLVTVPLDWINFLLSLAFIRVLTPLECLGFAGYYAKLVFWMALAPGVFAILCVCQCTRLSMQQVLDWATFGEHAVATGVKMLFIFYPLISTVAFEAFACPS